MEQITKKIEYTVPTKDCLYNKTTLKDCLYNKTTLCFLIKNTVTASTFFILLACNFTPHMQARNNTVLTTVKIRPQSLNGPRKVSGELPGENTHVYMPAEQTWPDYDSLLLGESLPTIFKAKKIQSFITITPAYQKSFNSQAIARSLFGTDLICSKTGDYIAIQGSQVPDRDPRAWLAENFYLPEDYESTLSFKPTISNTLVDFNAYIGLDPLLSGLYCRLYAPFVHSQWNLHMKENVLTPLITDEPGLLPTATAFFAGATPEPETIVYGPASNTAETMIIHNPLTAAKMSSLGCSNHTVVNGFGEIRGELGWDFLRDKQYHCGAYLTGAAPTGNKPNANFLFAATVGNRKHIELGAGVTGHWEFWAGQEKNQHAGIYCDTQVTHLFNAQEQRTFDLKGINGPLSRYMLAAKMGPATNGLAGREIISRIDTPIIDPLLIPATYQFDNELIPVANLTKQKIDISIGAQVDATVWLNYTINELSCDVGYTFWMQTAEQIRTVKNGCSRLKIEPNSWVLKGDALTMGYGILDIILSQKVVYYPISFSESEATIHSGTNQQLEGPTINNNGIDNPLFALTNFVNPTTVLTKQALGGGTEGQIKTSIDPIFLSEQSINLAPNGKAVSHTLFGNIGYTAQCQGAAPYIGIGGQVEFGSSDQPLCNQPQSTNTNCSGTAISFALSQWGIWAKMGVMFN